MRRSTAWALAAAGCSLVAVVMAVNAFRAEPRPDPNAVLGPLSPPPEVSRAAAESPSPREKRAPSVLREPPAPVAVAAPAAAVASLEQEAAGPSSGAPATAPHRPRTPEAPAALTPPEAPSAPKKPDYTIDQQVHVAGFERGSPIFVRVFKKSAELEVWLQDGDKFRLFKTYPICAYSGTLGPKLQEGDHQAPEGFYFVSPAAMNPNSSFHLSFNIGFPNAYDRAHGRTGSFLMVHGSCVSVGCYAMTDDGIEEIYTLAERAFGGGQPFFRIHIFPFRMTAENMTLHAADFWAPFWENLREGYDLFEQDLVPPDVSVADREYVFNSAVVLSLGAPVR